MSDQTACLSPRVRELVTDPGNQLVLHQASTLEIQIKYDKGNLPLRAPPQKFVPDSIAKHHLLYSTLSDADIYFLERLPKLHRDPFDRLLVCHAIINGLTILSPALSIHQYPVNYFW